MRGRDGRLRRHRDQRCRPRRLHYAFPASSLADPAFRHLVARFHALGPRVMAELLAELGAEGLMRTTIETRLEEYVARLDRDLLKATGGGAEILALRPWLVPPSRDTPQPEEGL